MTKTEITQQALELPEAERLEIADAIWASLDDPDALPPPQWQRDLLGERLAGIDTRREKGLGRRQCRDLAGEPVIRIKLSSAAERDILETQRWYSRKAFGLDLYVFTIPHFPSPR